MDVRNASAGRGCHVQRGSDLEIISDDFSCFGEAAFLTHCYLHISLVWQVHNTLDNGVSLARHESLFFGFAWPRHGLSMALAPPALLLEKESIADVDHLTNGTLPVG
jgi:hypothetical protein